MLCSADCASTVVTFNILSGGNATSAKVEGHPHAFTCVSSAYTEKLVH